MVGVPPVGDGTAVDGVADRDGADEGDAAGDGGGAEAPATLDGDGLPLPQADTRSATTPTTASVARDRTGLTWRIVAGRVAGMDVFPLAALSERQAASGGPYLEFLRVPDLSLGIYVLEAGAVDRQRPHTEDEAYVVLDGHARFTAGDETGDVGPGDTIFVAAGVPHRFHDITQTLRLIVAFGPAEESRAGA